MDFPLWPEAKAAAHSPGEKSCSVEKLVDRHTLIFWLLTKQARRMPKSNKITHYCVIGAVFPVSRNFILALLRKHCHFGELS